MNAIVLSRPTIDDALNLCKIGQGAACCRYIAMAPDGWSCLKLTEQKLYLDHRVETETICARGDNCPGKADQ